MAIEEPIPDCGWRDGQPFSCTELYAGNERAHRHVRLPGLEGDVIALPAEGVEGGDLYALFSCGANRFARIVLADAVGHGFSSSAVARHIHNLLHRHSDVRDTSALLAALNARFEVRGPESNSALRLATVATATYDRYSGELNFAYAAAPHLLLWRQRERDWYSLGEGIEGLPLGVIAGEQYSQQSTRLEPGDMVAAFSDAIYEVESPRGEQLGSEGFVELARRIARGVTQNSGQLELEALSAGVLDALTQYHGSDEFKDDLTLLMLRRPVLQPPIEADREQ
jgi:phosphoserine phosphatase RsbU/P